MIQSTVYLINRACQFSSMPYYTLIYLSNYGITQTALRIAVTILPDSSFIRSGVVQVMPSVE